ncbi:MAG: serpin family protein [candidate division KSB1 bacterium]|nr:serpin family protein [candidate division KSB1 bacterium]
MMSRTSSFVLAIMIAIALGGCSKILEVDLNDGGVLVQTVSSRVTTSQNNFCFDLLETVNNESGEQENIFLSPLSASLALTMTLNGADGETYEEMRQTLGYNNADRQEINTTCRALIDELYNLSGGIEFNLANSIWLNDQFTLQDSFQQLNTNYFRALIESLDFSQSQECTDTINDWVEDQTHDRIQDLVKAGDIDAMTLMLLINAIYFKADWKYQFDPEETREQNFNLLDGNTSPCDLMELKGEFDYYSDNQIQAIDLPYANEHYSMTVLLPRKMANIGSLLKNLDTAELNRILAGMQPDSVILSLPKLELEYEKSLKTALQSMGMQRAFTGGADFSNMVQERQNDIFISEVRQKSFLKVEETGTEAAAATVVIMELTSIGGNEDIYMRVDHPFLFVIRENRTGTILFVGKIMQPARR